MPARERVVPHGLGIVRGESHAGVWIGDGRRVFAPNHEGLQALRAHHRAHPHSRSLISSVCDDAGEADLILPGRTDHRGVNAAAESRLQRLDAPRHGQSPESRGIGECNCARVRVDQKNGWRKGGAADRDHVEAAALQGLAKRTFAASFADAARERALGRHGEASQACVGMPRDNAGSEDQQIRWGKRIETSGCVAQQQRRCQQPAAAVDAPEIVVGYLGPRAAAGKVDVQNFSVVPGHVVPVAQSG